MNFVQWLSSLDELLYELMSWLVFFPVTLWRTVRRPLMTMRYAEEQLLLDQELQYRDGVSPPIMLILAAVVSQALGLAVSGTNPIVASHHGLANLVNDNTTLLLLRITLFGVVALIVAVRKVRRSGVALTRETLKPPFYAQCYLVAPVALAVAVGTACVADSDAAVRIVGVAVLAAGLGFFAGVQVRWFARELDQSIGRSIADAAIGLVEALVVFVAMGALFAR